MYLARLCAALLHGSGADFARGKAGGALWRMLTLLATRCQICSKLCPFLRQTIMLQTLRPARPAARSGACSPCSPPGAKFPHVSVCLTEIPGQLGARVSALHAWERGHVGQVLCMSTCECLGILPFCPPHQPLYSRLL